MGEGFPLWSMVSMAWEGREPLWDWIYLSVSAFPVFPDSTPSPFLLYPEIRNSDWIETFAKIIFLKISFLAAKEEQQPPYGVPTRVRGASPCLVAPSGTVSHWFFFPYFTNIPNIFYVCFYPVWTPFDMDFLRNKKHATKRNWHWINMLVPKNSIKSCQKYMKVV